MIKLYVKKLVEEAFIPTNAHVDDSGYDLYSVDDVVLNSLQTVAVRTGIAIEVVDGSYHPIDISLRGRSSMNAKGLLTHYGTIDMGYRGEVKVIITNVTPNPYTIKYGDKIAQLVFARLEKPYVDITEKLNDSERGTGGLGSTGR